MDNDKIKAMYRAGFSLREIAEQMNIGYWKVRSILKKEGITRRSVYKLSIGAHTSIEDMYNDGFSMKEISKKSNVSISTISRILAKRGVKTRKRKYSLDEDYFNSIDSMDKCYILGLMYADGNVSSVTNPKDPRYTIKISLQEGDLSILEKIKEKISYTGPLYYLKAKNNNWSNLYSLNVNSKKMCLALQKHGVVPNKTFKISFPKVLFSWDFIRGYFDGDGCFSISNGYGSITIAGNDRFCQGLSDFLSTNNVKNNLYKKDKISVICINSLNGLKAFHQKIYAGSSLFIERKRYSVDQYIQSKLGCAIGDRHDCHI